MVIKAPPAPPGSEKQYLMGARIWAHWSMCRFDIYEYVGADGKLGIYLFRHRRSRTMIGRTHAQVFHDTSWRPFLLDTEMCRRQGAYWV